MCAIEEISSHAMTQRTFDAKRNLNENLVAMESRLPWW